MRLVFDTESDDLADTATVLHCIAVKDIDSQKLYKFYGDVTVPGDHGSIEVGLNFLMSADELIGHNIIWHDLPLIERLYERKYKGMVTDTLVMSRSLNPDRPFPLGCPGSTVNPSTGETTRIGPHSIAAWGYRVGRFKPEFHDWKTFSLEMVHRCCEDTEINYLVYVELLKEIAECNT